MSSLLRKNWGVINQVAQFSLVVLVTPCSNSALQGLPQIQQVHLNLDQVMDIGGKVKAFRAGISQGNESCVKLNKHYQMRPGGYSSLEMCISYRGEVAEMPFRLFLYSIS